MDGASSTYTVPLALRLRERPDADALRAAFDDLVARHEVLRTVFAEADGEPYQRILAPGEARVPFTVREAAPEALADAVERRSRSPWAWRANSRCGSRCSARPTVTTCSSCSSTTSRPTSGPPGRS